MIKKSLIIASVFAVVILLSISFISASWFNEVFSGGKITGNLNVINKPAGGCPSGCQPYGANKCTCKGEISESDGAGASKESLASRYKFGAAKLKEDGSIIIQFKRNKETGTLTCTPDVDLLETEEGAQERKFSGSTMLQGQQKTTIN